MDEYDDTAENYFHDKDDLSADDQSESESMKSRANTKKLTQFKASQASYNELVKKNAEARRKVLFDSSSDSEVDEYADADEREDSFAYAATNTKKW